ncbi:GntR family transcriptional regulator [Radicibacter daui]|uniref:GntR family transcriptional regulator n=1 Tax=Radicibacter daui TaxID=3064829 RepID=UPI004046F231
MKLYESAENNGRKAVKTSLTEQAYKLLRKEIVECAMLPGHEFTELDIAERLSMSKTPVREALMRLQFEGMVRAYPRRGYMVEPVKVSDINEIFDMRQIVEAGATELAVVRASDKELEQLASLSASVPDDIYRANPDRANEINNRFHELIAQAAHNARLHRSVLQLLNELERFFYIEARSEVAYPDIHATHADIVGAMKDRDVARARSAITDHIEGTRAVLLKAVLTARHATPLWIG